MYVTSRGVLAVRGTSHHEVNLVSLTSVVGKPLPIYYILEMTKPRRILWLVTCSFSFLVGNKLTIISLYLAPFCAACCACSVPCEWQPWQFGSIWFLTCQISFPYEYKPDSFTRWHGNTDSAKRSAASFLRNSLEDITGSEVGDLHTNLKRSIWKYVELERAVQRRRRGNEAV